MIIRTPREEKTRNWRRNRRPLKAWEAFNRNISHKCESCGAKLFRKGVHREGYSVFCGECGTHLKTRYMSAEFLRAINYPQEV